MDWLAINDQDNQDMNHGFIGNLIMRNGFKVRYKNIEEYSSELQMKIKKVFKKNGYETKLTYLQNYAYCEVTALEAKTKYLDYAIAVGTIWAFYRISIMYFF